MSQVYPPTKPCSKCGEKSRTSYHSWCRPCINENKQRYYHSRVVVEREAACAYYARNREARKAYRRERNKTHPGRLRDLLKRRASGRVCQAVYAGRLVKPPECSKCMTSLPPHLLHGHHEDYDKPLDVRWLCSICHGVVSRIEVA